MTISPRLALFACLLLAACGGRARPPAIGAAGPSAAAETDAHVPDFARKPYAPFSREDAVAIAVREWRLFGQLVDDDPPGSRPPLPPELKPERQPGLWQRVGEYWWISQYPSAKETFWTGMHDEFGLQFPAEQDGEFAWSAAFISYVMRLDGAGARFPYAASHADYINAASRVSLGEAGGYAIAAERPDAAAPLPGDLICTGRAPNARMRFDMLPAGHFASHCDIVVQATPGMLTVIGGNVDDAVTMKHVPVTAEGFLAPPGQLPLDSRYEWFVVLRVLYDR